ncbi:hypothetical protein HO173_004765 [Letharia columbiana]|uniref:Uncharacterized protein n=1 Tax=Letharia columbiana TaxID=112416 RepID=A0A8H6FYZ9_9LECA|nr:uncharacterized protein HO173_004765 [Letharia columbiana]KAF6237296.1 hypothetical protein HO173_004765 [Letharia columbiana]
MVVEHLRSIEQDPGNEALNGVCVAKSVVNRGQPGPERISCAGGARKPGIITTSAQTEVLQNRAVPGLGRGSQEEVLQREGRASGSS